MVKYFHGLHDPTTQMEWNEMDAILVVVDWLSKMAKIALIKTIMTTFNSAKLLFNICIRHYEMPQSIMSDKDTRFMVGFWKTFVPKGEDKLVI
jgi:hypothetical protein